MKNQIHEIINKVKLTKKYITNTQTIRDPFVDNTEITLTKFIDDVQINVIELSDKIEPIKKEGQIFGNNITRKIVFGVKNIYTSLANALRRILLSEV